MAKGLEYTTLQRRYAIGQQTNEKMFNIISPLGNSNQNHNRIPLNSHEDGYNNSRRGKTENYKYW